MGWFDEDDDEEDNRPKKKLDMMDLTVQVMSSTAQTQADSNHREEGEDDDDPLDAYMKSLSSTNTGTSRPSMLPSTRLDEENEEEATSHWQSSEVVPMSSSTDLQEENESSTMLHQMFHKATNQQEQRQVDIQLDKVEHTTMNYSSISKNLLLGSSLATTSTAQGHEWRRQNSISCHPPLDPIYDFNELVGILPTSLMTWIANQDGITQPTLVQAQTLAVALSGKDAIVTASTGSGKTLAYLLPLVAHLLANNNAHIETTKPTTTDSRALVLVPTRELALQVEKVAKSLLADLPFSALAITGGNMGRYQLSQSLLKSKPHLIVATPGRLLDVLSAQQKSKQQWLLSEITFLVLDEADKMLQLGFAAQVSQLLENLRPDRQSLLTSATLHGKLERHCQDWMHTPTRISVGRSGISSEHVQQHVLCLPSVEAKKAFLKESLPTFCNVGRTIVFCATREGCEQLAQGLVDDPAIPSLQTLHGDKHPSDRKAALRAFTKGQIKLLIATDVAGRGLDIPQVATVINFDPAKNWDTHVHRIGRAGRLSSEEGQQEGSAYTLLTPMNIDFAQQLLQAYQREGRDIGEDVIRLANRTKQQQEKKLVTVGQSHGRGVGLGFSSHLAENSDSRPIKKSRWS